jgi:hypothetical protein
VAGTQKETGEQQLKIHSNLWHGIFRLTNKYLEATADSKRLAQGKPINAILLGGLLSDKKSTLIQWLVLETAF